MIMQAAAEAATWLTFHNVADSAVVGGMVLAYMDYRGRSKKEKKDAEVEKDKQEKQRIRQEEEQIAMHHENANKLGELIKFNQLQVEINLRRDNQFHEMQIQTAKLTEMCSGLNRRIEMVENRTS